MKITAVQAIPMSDPVPEANRHRTDIGTKVESDAALILIETDAGITGMGASLDHRAVIQAIVEHDIGPSLVGENPIYTEQVCSSVGRRYTTCCKKPTEPFLSDC